MSGLLEDWQHALRLYRRTPFASSVAVVTLAVAMAFVSAFVTLYVDLMERVHPGVEGGERLVTIGWTDGQNFGGIPLELIERISAEATTLEFAAGALPYALPGDADDDWLSAELVTRHLFPSIRPHMALGRGFGAAEHAAGGDRVAVISYDYWQAQFGGRDDVLGELVIVRRPARYRARADGRMEKVPVEPLMFRVVGVTARDFGGVSVPQSFPPKLWLPIESALTLLTNLADSTSSTIRSQFAPRVIARRADGVSAAAVALELNARYLDELRDEMMRPGLRFYATEGVVYYVHAHREAARHIVLFLIASALLAFTAAANVSLFLLARAPNRYRELGIRTALGAPPRRLARQLRREATLLVLAAVVIGLALGAQLAASLRGSAVFAQAEWRGATVLDWRVAATVVVFMLVMTLLVSLAPLIGLKKLGVAASSRHVSARAGVAQRIAGTTQTAVAGVVGGSALAFAWYLSALALGYPGYETRDIHVFRYSLPLEAVNVVSWTVDQARRRNALETLPTVAAVSLGNSAPAVAYTLIAGDIPHPKNRAERVVVQAAVVDARFAGILGLRLLYGRGPTDGEAGIALVNRTLARQLFGRDDVVGETLQMPAGDAPQREIIGVLEDFSYGHPTAAIQPTAFLGAGIFSPNGVALIKSSFTSAEVRMQIHELVDTGALEVTVNDVSPLAVLRAAYWASDRARGLLTIAAGVAVVAIAAFGFFGTQQFLVAAGRREYAIRASLGAGPRALGLLVLRRALGLAAPGLALGALLAFGAAAWLRDAVIVRGVSPLPVTAAVVCGLAAVLLAASVGPAVQARRTQPAPLLRGD